MGHQVPRQQCWYSFAHLFNGFLAPIFLLLCDLLSTLVKLFVTLDGPGTLTPQDKEDLCAIVKDTLVKLEADVSRSNINCSLNEKLSLKRDASYVASLTYRTLKCSHACSPRCLIALFSSCFDLAGRGIVIVVQLHYNFLPRSCRRCSLNFPLS